MNYFKRLLYSSRSTLNWRIVRGIAELQILTKASYFMLIFVPILAGIWPAVRLYVNNHNKAVVEATEIMNKHSISFNKLIDKYTRLPELIIQVDSKEEINNAANIFNMDVAHFKDDFTPRTLSEPDMPLIWVLGFFSSLFAVLAHLIYQLSSPEIIRKYTIEEFILDRKQDFANHPTDDAYDRALNYIDTTEGLGLMGVSFKKALNPLLDIHSSIVNEPPEDAYSKVRNLPTKILYEIKLNYNMLSEFLINKVPTKGVMQFINKEFGQRLREKVSIGDNIKISLIERGAKAEYLNWANKNLGLFMLSTLLYSIAIILIFQVIAMQIKAVLIAAGIIDLNSSILDALLIHFIT